MNIDPNAPAFPEPIYISDTGELARAIRGMTVRTWLAGMAMQAIITGTFNASSQLLAVIAKDAEKHGEETTEVTISRLAIEQADSLIEQLNRSHHEHKPTTTKTKNQS